MWETKRQTCKPTNKHVIRKGRRESVDTLAENRILAADAQKTLSELGILPSIEIILGLDDEKMKLAAIDIFSYIVEFNQSMVREFILKESSRVDDEDLLINLVIEQMINDSDPELGGAVQLIGILRLLLDPENMMATASHKLLAALDENLPRKSSISSLGEKIPRCSAFRSAILKGK
ncbi:serine/threonine-protein phosphatase 4 regulatory subunit 3 [Elysia marginata]|uniref:Serine/threonine-protein phosphatase 4 regulatory subunit 3 n=1 Tax=Elysia marginata TaxID=1093978 RepID=A0AAV4IHH8_9GAST|nr:serine/threonine-protein phosphatase 4 regulatory subunit 3 [Elysia marginata]